MTKQWKLPHSLQKKITFLSFSIGNYIYNYKSNCVYYYKWFYLWRFWYIGKYYWIKIVVFQIINNLYKGKSCWYWVYLKTSLKIDNPIYLSIIYYLLLISLIGRSKVSSKKNEESKECIERIKGIKEDKKHKEQKEQLTGLVLIYKGVLTNLMYIYMNISLFMYLIRIVTKGFKKISLWIFRHKY